MSRKCLFWALGLSVPCWLLIGALAFAGDTKPKAPTPAANANAESQSHSHAASSAATDAAVTLTQRALGIGGSTAPLPIDPESPCFVPKQKLGRGHRWFFGLVEMSAVAEFDPEVCGTLIQFERAKTERIRAELELMREYAK